VDLTLLSESANSIRAVTVHCALRR